ncbi:uncharacterized protein LOC130447464 [Diorhabda sublineata]|uniref:uncharacterized protein LOC130447464 n=1 Tax=Diorhabda sublineata TaxID=1163346 RepID=UPI0024E048E4|nr:uncharacterized protein LOC130447464 [Diorhabda sublineata]
MTQTFNPYAMCLIYLETDAEDKEDRVRDILEMFFRARFRSTAVLVHENQSLFNLFTFNFTPFVKETCEAPNTLNLVDRCVRGKMLNNSKTYFEKIHITDFSNCSLNIVTKPYPPFVINDKRGFEIDLLKIIGENLNVRFRINVHEDENWRESTNNTREGLINYVLEKKYLGIGNIGIGNILDNELEFSYSYHLEPIVFVVPIARDIPRWRILTVIFTTQMWGICIATIVVFGCGFCLNKKHENYKNPFLTSFQISITQPVHVFPKNDINRILFAALSVLSIMLTSAYTCTLIKDLKNPMKEHQISKNKEILQLSETLRYKFGGESIYKQLFDKEIIETNYQTMSGVNDTTKYWIKEVAEKKILWTLSSAHYVRYLIAINSDVTNEGDDQPKVYVAKFHFSSYPLSIVARKGHFMLNSINEVLKKMLVSGLVDFSWRKYERKILEEESRDSRIDTVPCEPLSIQHLQGAFVVLVFGYIFGVLMLVVEVFIKKIKLHNKIVGIRKSIIKKILKKNK